MEDTAGAGNSPISTLSLTILPVNDPPILQYVSVGVDEVLTYREDDSALNVGRGIYLRDVDSDIAFVSITITSELTLVGVA